jgi:Protein of unknown function (DUF2924)
MSRSADDRVSALATLSPTQLRETWLAQYGAQAPSLSPDLLRLGLAYRVQEHALGALPAWARRELDGHRSSGRSLKPGTRLVRSWNNDAVSVTVTDTGFDYDGREWASLTAIAKAVTGTQYSGPRFFGIGDHAKG